jgi:hypothetical protein
VTKLFDICANIKYVQLFNSVLFLETKIYMVGYNMFTLPSPGILHHVHLYIFTGFSEESVVPPPAGSGKVKSLKI